MYKRVRNAERSLPALAHYMMEMSFTWDNVCMNNYSDENTSINMEIAEHRFVWKTEKLIHRCLGRA